MTKQTQIGWKEVQPIIVVELDQKIKGNEEEEEEEKKKKKKIYISLSLSLSKLICK